MGKRQSIAMLGAWSAILILMLNGMRIGSTFGQTKLKVIADRCEYGTLAPGRLDEDLLEQRSLQVNI